MNENEFMNDVDSMFKKKLEQDPEYKILVKDKIENKIFQENDPGFNYSKVLFETMVGVKDGSIDVNKSKAIAAVAQTIINSFKAENEANKKLK